MWQKDTADTSGDGQWTAQTVPRVSHSPVLMRKLNSREPRGRQDRREAAVKMLAWGFIYGLGFGVGIGYGHAFRPRLASSSTAAGITHASIP